MKRLTPRCGPLNGCWNAPSTGSWKARTAMSSRIAWPPWSVLTGIAILERGAVVEQGEQQALATDPESRLSHCCVPGLREVLVWARRSSPSSARRPHLEHRRHDGASDNGPSRPNPGPSLSRHTGFLLVIRLARFRFLQLPRRRDCTCRSGRPALVRVGRPPCAEHAYGQASTQLERRDAARAPRRRRVCSCAAQPSPRTPTSPSWIVMIGAPVAAQHGRLHSTKTRARTLLPASAVAVASRFRNDVEQFLLVSDLDARSTRPAAGFLIALAVPGADRSDDDTARLHPTVRRLRPHQYGPPVPHPAIPRGENQLAIRPDKSLACSAGWFFAVLAVRSRAGAAAARRRSPGHQSDDARREAGVRDSVLTQFLPGVAQNPRERRRWYPAPRRAAAVQDGGMLEWRLRALRLVSHLADQKQRPCSANPRGLADQRAFTQIVFRRLVQGARRAPGPTGRPPLPARSTVAAVTAARPT